MPGTNSASTMRRNDSFGSRAAARVFASSACASRPRCSPSGSLPKFGPGRGGFELLFVTVREIEQRARRGSRRWLPGFAPRALARHSLQLETSRNKPSATVTASCAHTGRGAKHSATTTKSALDIEGQRS